MVLLLPDPALVVESALMNLLLGVCLNKSLIELAKHVLFDFCTIVLLSALVLLNVALCRLVESFEKFFVSLVLLGAFVLLV